MALQDIGNVDSQSVATYTSGAVGLAVSGATLMQLISVGVGIALAVVSLVCVVLTYRSNAKANRAKTDWYKAQKKALEAPMSYEDK